MLPFGSFHSFSQCGEWGEEEGEWGSVGCAFPTIGFQVAVEHILSGNHLRFANKYRVCDLNFSVSPPKTAKQNSAQLSCHLPVSSCQFRFFVSFRYCFAFVLSVFLVSFVSQQGHPSLFWFLLRFFVGFRLFLQLSLPVIKIGGLIVLKILKQRPPFSTLPYTHVFCFVCSVIEGSVYSATLLHTADLKLSLPRALHLFGTRDFA